MVEEGRASEIVHMSIKMKRKNQRKGNGKERQKGLMVGALVFVVVFVFGFWYLLSKGEAEVNGSKNKVIVNKKVR